MHRSIFTLYNELHIGVMVRCAQTYIHEGQFCFLYTKEARLKRFTCDKDVIEREEQVQESLSFIQLDIFISLYICINMHMYICVYRYNVCVCKYMFRSRLFLCLVI